MRRDSSDVRSSVRAFAIGAWYSMSRLASSIGSATDDPLLARAVELDGRAVGRLAATGELDRHRARHLELAAHDPDVAAGRAARADDARELVVERGEERRAGVADQGDDPVRAGVHEGEDVVRALHHLELPGHRCRV